MIPGPVSADSIAGAKRLFYEFGGKPVKVDRGYGHPGVVSGQSSSQIFFSGRHEGLAIYFARLVRPIWREKITVMAPVPTNPKRQISNVAEKTLVSVQRDLTSLKTFIDRCVTSGSLVVLVSQSTLTLLGYRVTTETRNCSRPDRCPSTRTTGRTMSRPGGLSRRRSTRSSRS